MEFVAQLDKLSKVEINLWRLILFNNKKFLLRLVGTLVIGASIYYFVGKPSIILPTVCDEDIKSFCSGNPQNNENVMDCLAGHIQKLQPQCSALVLKAVTFQKSCENEIRQFCPQVAAQYKLGGPTVKDCLLQNKGHLSEQCRAACEN